MKIKRALDLDRIGTFASSLCAVHCFLVAVAFGLLPVMGLGFMKDERVDRIFIVSAALIGTLAVFQGYRKHGSLKPASWFILGLSIILFSHTYMHHFHGGSMESLSHGFSVVGGIFLVYYHFLNRRLTKNCDCAVCNSSDAN
ncbi:MAG: MerC domain-containing protein [Armatimonadetes bacterium]|nr:MerC domain-containing protein [Armatimonadota bacterium]